MLTSVLTHLDLTAAHSPWGTHVVSWCSTCLPDLNRDSSLEELLVRSANVLFALSPFLFIDKICLWLLFSLLFRGLIESRHPCFARIMKQI